MLDISFRYGDLEFYLLILMRVASFMVVAPFFSMTNTPNNVKILFAAFVSMILAGVVPLQQMEYNTVLGFTIIVLKEVATGLIIGFGALMCNFITAFAGHLVDMQTGLSMTQMFDPMTRDSVTITGVIYQYVVFAMMIVSGMYRFILRAIVDSFTLIPVNGAVFHSDELVTSVIRFMGTYIVIGFRITLPVFIVTFMLNAILGVLAKVAPQMNMFAVGVQIKVLVGLSILLLTTSMLGSAADFIFTNMREMMREFTYGLSAQ